MRTETVTIEEPKLAKLLFSDPRCGWLWLPLRLYLGYMWFEAGWHKFTDPRWIGTPAKRSLTTGSAGSR